MVCLSWPFSLLCRWIRTHPNTLQRTATTVDKTLLLPQPLSLPPLLLLQLPLPTPLPQPRRYHHSFYFNLHSHHPLHCCHFYTHNNHCYHRSFCFDTLKLRSPNTTQAVAVAATLTTIIAATTTAFSSIATPNTIHPCEPLLTKNTPNLVFLEWVTRWVLKCFPFSNVTCDLDNITLSHMHSHWSLDQWLENQHHHIILFMGFINFGSGKVKLYLKLLRWVFQAVV